MTVRRIIRLTGLLVMLLFVHATAAVQAQSDPHVPSVEITFSGNSRVSTADLIADFKRCSGESWKQINQRMHEFFAQKCSRSLMHNKGFWRAQIVDVSSRVQDDVYVVQIKLGEGPRYRLGKLTIEGNAALPEKEILDLFGQRSGEVADGSALQALVFRKLKDRYDELGYVQYNAEFEPTFKDPLEWTKDGEVGVVITIDEGPRFMVKRVTFAGVEDEIAASLTGEFMVKAGDIASVQRLQLAVRKLNELERFEHIDTDRDIEIRTDEEAAEIDVVISVRNRFR